jgi:imidazolonepropionase-like amidohydrolase
VKQILLLAACCVLTVSLRAQVTAIRAGALVDPDTGTVLTDQIILIRDSKIERVGKGIAIPAGAALIDLTRMTVLPGLIDCHTHLADGVHDPEPVNRARKLPAQLVLESVPNARVMLESGFTTVRDVGVYRALTDVALRDAINRGDIIGPRMYVAGAYVTISAARAP